MPTDVRINVSARLPRLKPMDARKAPSQEPSTDPDARSSSMAAAADQQDLGPELVFGLVGPTGTDLDGVQEALETQLRLMQYEMVAIRLSDLISLHRGRTVPFTDDHDRIATLMELGTRLRTDLNRSDIVARLGIAGIRAAREKRSGSTAKPAARVAYLVRSFKRPEEVDLFRTVYGRAFTLVSVYATKATRVQSLARSISPSLGSRQGQAEQLAMELIARDYEEEGKQRGQRVGKTFPLADFFVTSESGSRLTQQIERLVRLTFGDQYISPSRDEQSMFFAKAAALRSLDLSRQVGAAVVGHDGEVLATGCNEVPKFGGGLYWADDPNVMRDFERGIDANVQIKREMVQDAFDRLKRAGMLSDKAVAGSQKLAEDALFGSEAYLDGAKLFDVIEFGRAVHAEMAAISQAARSGVRLQGARLFCTTFPCHICARHILAAGITEVVFIEPYEKSRTADLYGDAISIEPSEPSHHRANFRAFSGVAPRRYMEFFETGEPRKTKQGTIKKANQTPMPRLKRLVLTYPEAESFVLDQTPLPAPKSGELP